MNGQLRNLRIWQQNLNRSAEAQADLLHSANPDEFDILALQEPYIDFLNLTRATGHWRVVYPATHHRGKERSRSVLLVNAKISTNEWSPVAVPSPDITAITLVAGGHKIHLFNMYVDGAHDRAIHAAARATTMVLFSRDTTLSSARHT